MQRAAVIAGFAVFWHSGRFWMPDQSGMDDGQVVLFLPLVIVFLVFAYVALLSAVALWRDRGDSVEETGDE